MPVFMKDQKSGERFVIDKAIMLMGRHPDCDVVLEESPKVSRRHCCVAQVNEKFIIRDLGSMNGVRLNGELIRKEAELKPGDQFAVGDICFVLDFVSQSENGRQSQPDSEGINQNLSQADDKPEKKNGSDPSQPARQKSPPRPLTPARDLNLSQSIPIALDEEGKDFAVESNRQAKSSYGLEPEKEPSESQNYVENIDEEEADDAEEK